MRKTLLVSRETLCYAYAYVTGCEKKVFNDVLHGENRLLMEDLSLVC